MVVIVGRVDRDDKKWWILNSPVTTFVLLVFGKTQNIGLELYFHEAEPLSSQLLLLSVWLSGLRPVDWWVGWGAPSDM